MNFEDHQLRECYERNLSEMAASTDAALEVSALIATHDFFQMLEGPHSSRVHETMDLLLSLELRPRLRDWYRRHGNDINQGARDWRDKISNWLGKTSESSARASFLGSSPGSYGGARSRCAKNLQSRSRDRVTSNARSALTPRRPASPAGARARRALRELSS